MSNRPECELLATLPLLFVFFVGQRYIIGGISLTGLKG